MGTIRSHMRTSTLTGVATGLLVLLAAARAVTGDMGWMFNATGLLVVLGGTLAASLGSFPHKEVRGALRIFVIALRDEQAYLEEDMAEVEEVAALWYRHDILRVEQRLEQIKSPFLRTGVQLVIDHTPPKEIMEILQWRIARLKAKEHGQAHVFRAMAAYAPAFGLLGTLLGLVGMLEHMAAPAIATMGSNLAVALVTTFYGVLLANLVFKPMALRLERRTEQRAASLVMIMEAVALLRERRSPAFIRETLRSFTHDHVPEPRQPGIEAGEIA